MVVDIFLAVFFSIIGIHYSATAIGLKQRDGFTRIHYGPRGSRSWWIRWVFNIFRASILGLCILRLFIPAIDDLVLFTHNLPFIPYVRWIGAGLMLISLFLISYVHAYMRDEWHSGIDESVVRDFKTIKSGPYTFCRHPLFASVMVGMFGFYFALPSFFSLISLLVGMICLIVQANYEERSLSEIDDYQAYQANTRKWPISLPIGN